MEFLAPISYKEYIKDMTTVDILKHMAHHTTEYNGTIESFLREFPEAIDSRPELIEQY